MKKYIKKYNDIAYNLSLLGLTNVEIAQSLDIHEDTLYTWKKKYEDFDESLKKGREDADGRVARSLFNKALQGDVTACIYWLKCRRRKIWTVTGNEGHTETVQVVVQEPKIISNDLY